MSKMSLVQLVNTMQGKSLTYGWDALTLYDQRKTNELLSQLYVERFNTEDGYIEPLSIVADWGGGSYKEHIYNLKLSAPRLSFEISDPELPARARLTMDMIGGMIVSTKAHTGGARYVSKMLQVLPIRGPQLWMDQPVTKGVVTGAGEVLIDLTNAVNFKANFVMGEINQAQIGARFKAYFDETLTPEQKRFSLGRLSNDSNGVLTPKNFEIRTMASAPTAVMGAEDYGDGAVLMFITLKDGQDGTGFPNINAPYLIPADGNGARFTGAMLLSSKALAEKILKPAIEQSVGAGMTLALGNSSQHLASTLIATGGGASTSFTTPTYWYSGGGPSFPRPIASNSKLDPFTYAFSPASSGGAGFVVGYVAPASLQISWAGKIVGVCRVSASQQYFNFGFESDYSLGMRLGASVDKETNHVELGGANITTSEVVTTFHGNAGQHWNTDGESVTRNAISERTRSVLFNVLRKIDIPSIDTFLLRNLLFPGHNALHLTEAFVPGDLAVFGEIDPLRTTTVMAPLNSTIEAGSTLQFSLTPMPANVQWRVRDVDGGNTTPGAISSTGRYTAPSQAQLPNSFITVMVTAQGTLDGQPVQSSALVSVLHSAIQTNPLYASCDTGRTLELEGKTQGSTTLQWRILTEQWGSTLTAVADEPDKRLYTAGTNMDAEVPFPIDIIEIKNTASNTISYIYLTINKPLVMAAMVLDESSDPATGTVRFVLWGGGSPIVPNPGVVTLTWHLLAGEGSVDQDGVYTEPETVVPGSFAVVSATANFWGANQKVHGYTVIPLPLDKYAELIGSVSQTIRGI
ncbi:hypothetical protein [Pseudomonas sp. T1.Ur]|uniref:hypothetical protein n=1 Tax=Pseudomonas sp. T1.Ur TaxID=2928704 RepID=UPI00201DABAF|nr:hypothetical protein [Pseudomonas sp. T1.Ur]MCL6703291.1 hypothetical protein [Pseudomonas sp. T1.Ur]